MDPLLESMLMYLGLFKTKSGYPGSEYQTAQDCHASHKFTAIINTRVWQWVDWKPDPWFKNKTPWREEGFLKHDPWNGFLEEREEITLLNDFTTEPPSPPDGSSPTSARGVETRRLGLLQTAGRVHFPFCKLVLFLSVATLCQGVHGDF